MPGVAGAQRSDCGGGGEGGVGIEVEGIKKGTGVTDSHVGPTGLLGMTRWGRKTRKAATSAPAALSEAESAEIAAGQIRFLPDDLRVQHGAQCAEVCGRPRPCFGMGRRVSGQNSLEPHPAAR